MEVQQRRLQDLGSVGPATMRDFELLGIRSVKQLERKNPEQMYRELCGLKGGPQDICCLDVFRAAVAQARNSQSPVAQRQWWYWSKKRKAKNAPR